MASVHRFRDRVAVEVGGGKTVYLTAKEARKLARGLYMAARSCDTTPFTDAPCLEVVVSELETS